MVLAPKKIKKSKIKQRRRRVALIIIIVIALLILYSLLHARNYEKKYTINEFEVLEQFDKKKQVYLFQVKKEDQNWEFIVEHKYITKHKLLNEIELLETDDTKCLKIKSEKLTTYPQCNTKDELISYHLVANDMKEKLGDEYFPSLKSETKTYEKIDIKNIDDNTYYIWNYKGFYQINKNKQANIKLFDKDIYDISNVIKVNNILVIPNYNETYYFNRFYLLDLKEGKTTTWDFKDSLYFDGYNLGYDKNSLFYLDRKTKLEWEIDPKKKRMRKVGTENKDGKILKNNNWEKISITKLINESQYFEKEEIYHYEINQGLYVSYLNSQTKKKISDKDVKEIVAILNDKVYYLVGHSLYYYSTQMGEVEVMSYFEWNFNYKNMIFIKD